VISAEADRHRRRRIPEWPRCQPGREHVHRRPGVDHRAQPVAPICVDIDHVPEGHPWFTQCVDQASDHKALVAAPTIRHRGLDLGERLSRGVKQREIERVSPSLEILDA
jgi:hypothetical protein